MSNSAGVVTLLFTDLVASTELLARVGDDAADGLMVAFTSSLQAIRSAVAIQQATEEHNGRNPDLPLRVRIGLRAGAKA